MWRWRLLLSLSLVVCWLCCAWLALASSAVSCLLALLRAQKEETVCAECQRERSNKGPMPEDRHRLCQAGRGRGATATALAKAQLQLQYSL